MMQSPRFLIIGAIKSGTTTLCKDLESTGRVSFPAGKEPNDLASDDVLSPAGTAKYLKKYKYTPTGTVAGDASIRYSLSPAYGDIPRRALQVLGAETKVLYLVREPLSRIKSHYRFGYSREWWGHDPNIEIAKNQYMLDAGMYASVITRWLDVFGAANICVVQLESYAADRVGGLRRVMNFLGFTESQYEVAPQEVRAVHNRTDELVMPRPMILPFVDSGLYQSRIRRLVPRLVKDIARRIAYQTPENRLRKSGRDDIEPIGFSTETYRLIADTFGDEIRRLKDIAVSSHICWPEWDRFVADTRRAAEMR